MPTKSKPAGSRRRVFAWQDSHGGQDVLAPLAINQVEDDLPHDHGSRLLFHSYLVENDLAAPTTLLRREQPGQEAFSKTAVKEKPHPRPPPGVGFHLAALEITPPSENMIALAALDASPGHAEIFR